MMNGIFTLRFEVKSVDNAPKRHDTDVPQWLWEASCLAYPERMGRGDTMAQAMADLLKAIASTLVQS
jgi:hypothetical protein